MADPQFDIAGYLHFLGEKKIMASRCRDCGKVYLPPRPICPDSHTRNMDWAALSGEGEVKSFTTIAIVPAAMAARGYGRDRTYVSGFVALKEGPTVPARIKTGETPVTIGMPVRADFVEETDGERHHATLVFRPA